MGSNHCTYETVVSVHVPRPRSAEERIGLFSIEFSRADFDVMVNALNNVPVGSRLVDARRTAQGLVLTLQED